MLPLWSSLMPKLNWVFNLKQEEIGWLVIAAVVEQMVSRKAVKTMGPAALTAVTN